MTIVICRKLYIFLGQEAVILQVISEPYLMQQTTEGAELNSVCKLESNNFPHPFRK